MLSTKKSAEKAILVCTSIPRYIPGKKNKEKINKEHLEELEFLTKTAGAEVVGTFYQERDKIDTTFFIGKGKAHMIAEEAESKSVDLVIFENQLSPTQIRNLEKIIKCKVIDKPALILDIFASNARTSEAKTQVELAQLQYLLPRLTRQWTHLSKQLGGIGTKGPGETQIETDRRLISTRISVLKDKLKKIEEQRKTQRAKRQLLTRLALVGYTNAGKSTLLNILTHSNVYVEDKLFATLDTSTKSLKEIGGKKLPNSLLVSDTVGFIRNLPHDLIESFKSTLAEVIESDILLHVIDISSLAVNEQIKVVEDTLSEIGASEIPVIMVFNKVDKLDDDSKHWIHSFRIQYPGSVFISALKGLNLSKLYEQILIILKDQYEIIELSVPANHKESYKILNKLHEISQVISIKYLARTVKIKLKGSISEIDRIISEHRDVKIKSKESRGLTYKKKGMVARCPSTIKV